jgi:hypothetical protein
VSVHRKQCSGGINRSEENRHHIYRQLRDMFLVKNQQVSARTKHIDIRHHFMRDLQDRKELDVRFERSENNSSDIMTKNTREDIHDKHIQKIRNDTLPFWRENVKQESSVTEFSQSQIATEYRPVHSSTSSSYSSSTLCKSTVREQVMQPEYIRIVKGAVGVASR